MKNIAGGNSPKASFKMAVDTWFLQHAQAFFFSLGQLYRNPMATLLTTSVIGISLALPLGFYVFLENARRVTSGWAPHSHISLFLKPDIDSERIEALKNQLHNHLGIHSIDIISKEKALLEYKENSGFAGALDALEDNPLPTVIIVRPEGEPISSADNEGLIETLRAIPEVDLGQFDRQWARRLFQIIAVFQRFVVIIAALLSVAVLLIVGNTIRMAIYNRYREIEINKLFGATDAFIQRPFLYSGFFHGLGGSLMAWGLLEIVILLLNGPVRKLAGLYKSDFSLLTLDSREVIALFLIGALLGLVGSWLSVKRHLGMIDPI